VIVVGIAVGALIPCVKTDQKTLKNQFIADACEKAMDSVPFVDCRWST
jgi:AMMECR1 domain-containing protein